MIAYFCEHKKTLMKIIFYILLAATAISIIQAIRAIFAQKAHLTDSEISDFTKMRMDATSDQYTRFIGHLAHCQQCQERLNDAQKKV